MNVFLVCAYYDYEGDDLSDDFNKIFIGDDAVDKANEYADELNSGENDAFYCVFEIEAEFV